MKVAAFACVAVILLHGCASEWRTEGPAKPITYQVPAYRAERSVGNLRRLAILPPQMKRVGHFSIPVAQEDKASRPSGQSLSRDAATFLATEKGYETILVTDAEGAWRPQLLVHSEFGSVQELAATWEVARTDSEVEAAVRRIGQAYGADGVVALWTEYMAAEEDESESVTQGLLNIFLVNIPLFYSMSHSYAGATIFETATGRPVWKVELAGPDSPALSRPGKVVPAVRLFENLENAIPRQVIK
jgi:hypothetical protein